MILKIFKSISASAQTKSRNDGQVTAPDFEDKNQNAGIDLKCYFVAEDSEKRGIFDDGC